MKQLRRNRFTYHHPEPMVLRSLILAVVAEVATLKSMYSEMERTVSRLREDLKSFQETIGSLHHQSERIPEPPIFHGTEIC